MSTCVKNENVSRISRFHVKSHSFLPQIKLIFIELCNFARLFKKTEYHEALHRWLYIIKNMGEASTEECPFEDDIYREFFEHGKVNKLSTMEKEDYAKSILEYQEVKDTIEFERDYARAEGEAKGEAKGRAEEKLAIAKLLLEQNVDIEIIIRTTGLTEEEILSN